MKRLLPYINVQDVDEYFNLPREKRTKLGLYLVPYTLPFEMFSRNNQKGWDGWEAGIRKEFPIQWFVREWCFSCDNPLYLLGVVIHRHLRDAWYNIKRMFKPVAPRFRKAWKRWEYRDIADAIADVNFALIQDFYHEEVESSEFVDWSSSSTSEFFTWLKGAIQWIEIDRKDLIKEIDVQQSNAFRDKSDTPYAEKYRYYNSLNNKLVEEDTKILTEMIKYRDYFWS
jgi:hypothetical protein